MSGKSKSTLTLSTSRKPTFTLGMRKLNLNLPPSYFHETSEQRLNRIIKGGAVGAKSEPQKLSKSQLSTLIDKISSFKAKIEIKRRLWGTEISLSGATAELNTKKDDKIGVTTDFSGKVGVYRERRLGNGITEKISTQMGRPLRLEYKVKDLAVTLTFSSTDEKSMSFDRWEFSVSWGNTGPDIFSLEKIFTAGEKGMRGSFEALKKLENLNDVTKVKRELEPHMKPISESVKKASDIAKIKPGINIGISVQGPTRRTTLPSGPTLEELRTADVQIKGVLTIRF
jgi:hypothetical protein